MENDREINSCGEFWAEEGMRQSQWTQSIPKGPLKLRWLSEIFYLEAKGVILYTLR